MQHQRGALGLLQGLAGIGNAAVGNAGFAPGKLLLAPEWTRNKKRVLLTIRRRAGLL